MRDLVPSLQAALAAQRPTVWCRLVETRGSTPQKAGATMLVHADGSQAGTLGGGCVEAEVKRRALAALETGEAQLSTFQLDSDYGWDDGLICGGRMQVLVQPIVGASAHRYYGALVDLLNAGQGLTEAVVFNAAQAGIAAPASFLFDERAAFRASLGGPVEAAESDRAAANSVPPSQLFAALRPLDRRPRPYVEQGISYLPVLSRCRLVIVGGGHVGKAVADLAVDLDFDVWAVDDRDSYVSAERFPRAQRRVAGPIDQVLPALEITPHTYCLIVTRGHSHDERALYHLASRGARYVGLIGSRRKIKLIYDDLLQAGVPLDDLARVFAPVGIDIGSQTVTEIAVSICAELIAHRNLGVVPARPAEVIAPGQ